MRNVFGHVAYEAMRPNVERALAGQPVKFEQSVPFLNGGARFIEASYVPHAPNGTVLGFVAFVADISERKASEATREAIAGRNERLMKVATALADAITPQEVYAAVVTEAAEALGASSSGLWLRDSSDRRVLRLANSLGYSLGGTQALETLRVDAVERTPVLDAFASGEPVWIHSQEELLLRYPHLDSLITSGRSYSIACLPVASQGTPLGAIGFTFENAPVLDAAGMNLLCLVARYSGQALERLRLYHAEQSARMELERAATETERARLRAEVLHEMAAAVIRAKRIEDVFDAALSAMEGALGVSKSAVLAFGDEDALRFRSWRCLSPSFRQAFEGLSRWSTQTDVSEIVDIEDLSGHPDLMAHAELFRTEGIRAVTSIPLRSPRKFKGTLLLCATTPRRFSRSELEIAEAISNHITAAIGRFAALAELQKTIQFNEMFTGILGHDLRNPLGAIVTGAELAQILDTDGRMSKTLTRILSSGQRMARMIEQLLDFTRIRVGNGLPLQASASDLMDVLRPIIEEVEVVNPGCTFDLQHMGGSTRGSWDVDRLSQVFSNLLVNAAKHGIRENGVRLMVSASGEMLVVKIHNDGVIPPELLPRIFEPLVSHDSAALAAPRGSEGLGLGLYITEQ